jgi:peptidoglycan endopeptidase LytF
VYNYLWRQCPPNTRPYTVRPGDTFYSLAIRFNTTVPAIVAANPTVNPVFLQVGQVICIPRPGVPGGCPAGTRPYTIRSGDTLFAIARRFNVSLDALLDANPGIDPEALQIGQVICIPRPGPPPPAECPAGTRPYIIRSGDTLFAIARRFNVSLSDLLDANPGIDPEALQIGQVICIPRPGPPPPAECPAGTRPYTIRSGDTLFAIARRFNVSLDALLDANPGIDPEALQIGQVICVPQPGPPVQCPPGAERYVIRSGDTLFAIARRFNVTVDAILDINPGLDPNNLQVGRIICIPEEEV